MFNKIKRLFRIRPSALEEFGHKVPTDIEEFYLISRDALEDLVNRRKLLLIGKVSLPLDRDTVASLMQGIEYGLKNVDDNSSFNISHLSQRIVDEVTSFSTWRSEQ